MISPEQLAGALERLDPRDRELLLLSLRRRVPDESLSRLFACTPAEVARRRAGAIERLADDLGVKRGEDFGMVLQGLLDVETWTFLAEGGKSAAAPGSEFAAPARRPPEEEPRVYRLPTREPQAAPAGSVPETAPAPAPADAGPAAADAGPAAADAGPAAADAGSAAADAGPAAADAARAPAGAPPATHLPSSSPAPPDGDAEPRRADPSPAGDAPAAAGSAPPAAAAAPPAAAPAPSAAGESPPASAPAPPASAPAPSGAGAAPPASAPVPPASAPAPSATGSATPANDASPAAQARSDAAGAPPDHHEPVLEMLAGDDPRKPARRGSRTALILAGIGVAAFAALAGFVGARELGGDSTPAQGGGDGVRHFVPQERGPLGAAPFPSEEPDISCYPTAYVARRTTLYREPGGEKLIRIAAKTEWGSPRVLGVAEQREGWVAVSVPELENGEVGWIPRTQARLDCVRWSLHADLAKRLLYVRKDGRTVKKLTVAVGSVRHPTPEGRFAVTDKLRVTDPNSPYGCCVLALSGHQTKLPADWPGGDRLAVHATTDADSIGKPVSLGCMRVTSEQARWLIETIPLGAPIFIRA